MDDMPKVKTPEERTFHRYKTPDDFLSGPRGPPPDDDPSLYMNEDGVDTRTLHAPGHPPGPHDVLREDALLAEHLGVAGLERLLPLLPGLLQVSHAGGRSELLGRENDPWLSRRALFHSPFQGIRS